MNKTKFKYQKQYNKIKSWAIHHGYQLNEYSIIWYFNRKNKIKRISNDNVNNYMIVINNTTIELNNLLKEWNLLK
jgi:hypothetical protein